ncbi:MAG: hypothetical protein ACC628_21035 [Pirellulaceae bacterium]
MNGRHPGVVLRRLALASIWVLPMLVATEGGSHFQADEPDFFPLAVGNRWDYRATYRLVSGNTLHAKASLTVEGVESIQGKEYFKTVSKVTGVLSDPTTTKYYRRGPEGVFEASKKRGAKETILLPAPVQNGGKWTTELPNELFFGKVISHQESSTGWKVPCDGETYTNCVKISSTVETRLGTVQHDQWLAPGIGIVRQSQRCKLWTMDSFLTKFVKGP